MSEELNPQDRRYITDPDIVGDLLPEFPEADGAFVAVCQEGHVHMCVGREQVTLSPDDAEEWVKVLYDAAQDADTLSNTDE